MANDPSNPDTEIIYVRSDPTIQIPNRSRAGITVKVIGPPGPPGGNIGPQGDDGDDGWTIPGPQGNQGPKGNTGAAGISNTPGPPGEDADEPYIMPGPQGNRGLQGVQGLPGQSNVPGPQGEDGEDSTFGVPGQQGAPGPKGDKGLQGYTSIGGLPGDDGDDGWIIPGAAGAAGPPGPTGPGTVAAVAFMATNTTNPDITTLDVVSFNMNPYNIGAYYNNGSCVWKPPAGVVALTVDIVGTSSHTASWIVYIYKNGVPIAQSQSGTNVLTGSLSCQDQASGSDSYWVEMALVPVAFSTVSFKLSAGLCKFQGALMQGTQGVPGVSVRGFDGEDGDDGMVTPGPAGTAGAAGSQGVQGLPGIGIAGDDGDDGFVVPGAVGPIGPVGPAGPTGLPPYCGSVLSLPPPSFGLRGTISFVFDSLLSVAAGAGTVPQPSGTNVVPIYCDGVQWLIWAGGQQGVPGVPGAQGTQGAPALSVPGRDGEDGDEITSMPPSAILGNLNVWAASQFFKKNIDLPVTADANTGVITVGGVSLLHTYGGQSTFLGFGAGNYTFTGVSNLGFGAFSLGALTSGAQNTCMGYGSATHLTSFTGAVAMGYNALNTAVTGGSTVAVGWNALALIDGHFEHTAIGYQTLSDLTGGDGNTAIGFTAGKGVISGGFNILLGAWNGTTVGITTGSGNTILGPASGLGTNLTNNIVICDGVGNIRAQYSSSGWALTGGVSTSGARVDSGYDYQTPTTGSTVTLANNVWHTIIDPAGALLALTVKMPAAPVDGQLIDFKVSQAITTLTVSPNSGQSVVGGPAAGASVAGITYNAIYRSANTTWYF